MVLHEAAMFAAVSPSTSPKVGGIPIGAPSDSGMARTHKVEPVRSREPRKRTVEICDELALCGVCEQTAEFERDLSGELVCTCCGVVVEDQDAAHLQPFKLPKANQNQMPKTETTIGRSCASASIAIGRPPSPYFWAQAHSNINSPCEY